MHVFQIDDRGKNKKEFRCKHANFVLKTEVPGEDAPPAAEPHMDSQTVPVQEPAAQEAAPVLVVPTPRSGGQCMV